jgi:DNA-directed RNA polymerase beta subunit
MTIAQIVETLFGKAACLSGEPVDATPFENCDTEAVGEVLKKYGFQHEGNEIMISGTTGEMIQAKIFVGVCYYQRLKHLTADKVHARSKGPVNVLTRQPVEGRSRDGGLRVGEMVNEKLPNLTN